MHAVMDRRKQFSSATNCPHCILITMARCYKVAVLDKNEMIFWRELKILELDAGAAAAAKKNRESIFSFPPATAVWTETLA